MSSSSPRHSNHHQKSHNSTTSDSSSVTQSSAVATTSVSSPTKSSFRLTSGIPTAEAIPVGGDAEERLLKKELSRRRQECSVSSVILATFGLWLVLAWVYYSSWFTFDETQRFQVAHRDGLVSAVTREWIVATDGTWSEPPQDTTEAPAPNIVLESSTTTQSSTTTSNSHETLSASTTTTTKEDEDDESSSFNNPPASSSSSSSSQQ